VSDWCSDALGRDQPPHQEKFQRHHQNQGRFVVQTISSRNKIFAHKYQSQFRKRVTSVVLIPQFQYLVPMALNQSGSVIYFLTLQSADLSLSVPVANSLTFVFTAISGWILGEQLPKRSKILSRFIITKRIQRFLQIPYLESS
jgi:hypothetical protein